MATATDIGDQFAIGTVAPVSMTQANPNRAMVDGMTHDHRQG
jgi:hypothetical protein